MQQPVIQIWFIGPDEHFGRRAAEPAGGNRSVHADPGDECDADTGGDERVRARRPAPSGAARSRPRWWRRLTAPGTGPLVPEVIGVGAPVFRSQLLAEILAVPGVTAVDSLLWQGTAFADYGNRARRRRLVPGDAHASTRRRGDMAEAERSVGAVLPGEAVGADPAGLPRRRRAGRERWRAARPGRGPRRAGGDRATEQRPPLGRPVHRPLRRLGGAVHRRPARHADGVVVRQARAARRCRQHDLLPAPRRHARRARRLDRRPHRLGGHCRRGVPTPPAPPTRARSWSGFDRPVHRNAGTRAA